MFGRDKDNQDKGNQRFDNGQGFGQNPYGGQSGFGNQQGGFGNGQDFSQGQFGGGQEFGSVTQAAQSGGYNAPPAYQPQPQYGSDAGPFTSDLSGQAFWLLLDQGYIPVGFVLGNSVYSMGVSGGIKSAFRGMAKGEVKEYTQLMYEARRNAMDRMRAEAQQLGAEGIIAVNLVVIHHGDLIEVTATGTAVKKDPNHTGSTRAQVVLDTSKEQGGNTGFDL